MSTKQQTHQMMWGTPVTPINLGDGSGSFVEKDLPGQDIFVSAGSLMNAFVGTSIDSDVTTIVVYGTAQIGDEQETAYALDPAQYNPEDITSFRQSPIVKCG